MRLGAATIGKNFENALSDIRNSVAGSEYYIPLATTAMSCDELTSNHKALNDQIQMWMDRIDSLEYKLFSGDKEAAKNMGAIIAILSERTGKYAELLSSKCGQTMTNDLLTGGDGSTQPPAVTNPEIAKKGINPLILIGGAGLIIYFVNRKKRR